MFLQKPHHLPIVFPFGSDVGEMPVDLAPGYSYIDFLVYYLIELLGDVFGYTCS